MRALASTLVAAASAAFFASASGCLVMGGKSYEESGVRVSSATLDQIEIGTTTQAWVLATLGEPTERTCVEGTETEVFRYDHTVTTSDGTIVFLLFAGGSNKTTQRTAFFEFENGIVSRYWLEK